MTKVSCSTWRAVQQLACHGEAALRHQQAHWLAGQHIACYSRERVTHPPTGFQARLYSLAHESTPEPSGSEATPPLHLRELTGAATPTCASALALLQRCAHTTHAQLSREQQLLHAGLQPLIARRSTEGEEHFADADLEQARQVCNEFDHLVAIAAPPVDLEHAPVRLSVAEATECVKHLATLVKRVEDAQQQLRSVLEPVALRAHAPTLRHLTPDPAQSPDVDETTADFDADLTSVVQRQAARARSLSAGDRGSGAAEGEADNAAAPSVAHDDPSSDDAQESEAIVHGVNRLMSETERGVLIIRLLCRHVRDAISYTHGLDVPASRQHFQRTGRSTVKLAQGPRTAVAVSIRDLVAQAIDDVRGFAVEKHGIGPDIVLVRDGDESLGSSTTGHAPADLVLCVPEFVKFVLAEVMKNSIAALVRKFGAWDVDDAPPVTVRMSCVSEGASDGSDDMHDVPDSSSSADAVSFWSSSARDGDGLAPDTEDHHAAEHAGSSSRIWRIVISDVAGGIPEASLATLRSFFATTVEQMKEGYGYSKSHGAAFSGLGVGMPMAVVYAELMGGSVTWEVDDGCTHVTLLLPADGFTFGPGS